MIKFKHYDQNQGLALPPYLDDLIDKQHLVRVISHLVDNIDIGILSTKLKSNKYNQGGNLPYHPCMMLKILIYSYARGIFTCRKIARQLRENVHFMWLSGMQHPDFRTINRYRSDYFKEILPQIFSEVLYVLAKHKLINLNTVFVDGTKISADSNKHKVVWSKNVERYRSKLRERVSVLFSEIDSLNTEEMERYGKLDLPECGEESQLTSSDLQKASNKITEALQIDGKRSTTETGKKLRKAARQLKADSQKLKHYEQQEADLSGRKSCSRTDPDASVMKMKNEELRPGYNVQTMTDKEFIVGASVSQNANDGTSFQPLMESVMESDLPTPNKVVADAGYGQEELYYYLEKKDIQAYIKYPSQYAENSNEAKYRFHYSKFSYDEKEDVFICPNGKTLEYSKTIEKQSITGYISEKRLYQCTDCGECPFREQCTQSETGRSLTVSFKLRNYQQKARGRLHSEYGKLLYRQRGFRSETVFGDWKHNLNFRRFHLRGLEKVRAEILLLCLAYNFRKLAKILAFLSSFFSDFCDWIRFILFHLKSRLSNQNYLNRKQLRFYCVK